MKRLILLFCVVTLSVSCGRNWWDDYTAAHWIVRNETEHTLMLRCPYYDTGFPSSNPMLSRDLEYRELVIEPKSHSSICKGMVPKYIESWFTYYFTQSAMAFGEDVSWQILSEDGAVLKTWTYSDRELPDQVFFEECMWSSGTGEGLWRSRIFIIMPDRI